MRTIALPYFLLSLLLLFSAAVEGQYRTQFESSNTENELFTKSEFNPSCNGDNGFYVGIRKGYNGNPGHDVIATGTINTTGNTGVNTKIYPTNPNLPFVIATNLAVTSISSGGTCVGYIVAFSARAVNDFNDIYVLRYDLSGSIVWQRKAIANLNAQEFIGNVFQLDNGNIMISGYKKNGPSGNVGSIIEMDLNGNTINTQELVISGFTNVEINDIIEVNAPGTSTKYALVGKIDDFAFVSLVDASFNSNFSRLFSSGMGFNNALNIVLTGGTYYVQGQGPIGGMASITLLQINAIPGAFPEGHIFWGKHFWLDSDTYGRDMELHPSGNGVVISSLTDFFGDLDYDGVSRTNAHYIDASGNEVWSSTIGGGAGENDQMLGGDINTDGIDLYMSGSIFQINQGGNKKFGIAKFDLGGSLTFTCFTPINLNEELYIPNQDDITPVFSTETFSNTPVVYSSVADVINPSICQANPSGCGSLNWSPLRNVQSQSLPFQGIQVQDLTEEALQDDNISQFSVNWMFIDEQGIKQGQSEESSYLFPLPPFPQTYTIMQTVSFIAPNGEFCTMMDQEEFVYAPIDCNFAMVEAGIDFFGTDEEIIVMDMTMNPSMIIYQRFWTIINPDGSSTDYSEESLNHPLTISGEYVINLNILYESPDGSSCSDFAQETYSYIPLPCDQEIPISTFDKLEKVQKDTSINEFDIALSGLEEEPGKHVILGLRSNNSANGTFDLEVYLEILDNNGQTIKAPFSISDFNSNIDLGAIRPAIIRPTYYNDDHTGYAVVINRTIEQKNVPLLITFNKDLEKICSQYLFYENRNVIINDFLSGNDNDAVFVGEALFSSTTKMLIGRKDFFCNEKLRFKIFEKANRATSITKVNPEEYAITGEFDGDITFCKMKNNLSLSILPGGNNFAFYDIAGAGTVDRSMIIRYLSTGDFLIGGHYNISSKPMYLLQVDYDGGLQNHKTIDHAGPEENLRSVLELKNGDIAVISGINKNVSSDILNFALFDPALNLKFSYNYLSGLTDKTAPGDFYQTSDNGIMTIGWGVPTNETWDIANFDSKFTKTNDQGITEECECIEEDLLSVSNSMTTPAYYQEDYPLDKFSISPSQEECYAIDKKEPFCAGGISIPVPCDANSSLASIAATDSCCVASLDFSQSTGAVHRIKITTPTPDLRFATITLDPSLILNPIGSQGPQLITIEAVGGGPIPNNITDYVQICYMSLSGFPAPTFQQLTIEYYDSFGQLLDCTDEIESECEGLDLGEDCVEFINYYAECDSLDPYRFKFYFQVQNNLPGTTLGNISFSSIAPFGTFIVPSNHVLTPPVPANSTSTVQCVDIINSGGAALPQLFDFTYFVYDTARMQCCHDVDTLAVILPNCCSPCDTSWLDAQVVPTELDSCCQSIDLYNNCDFTLKKIVFNSISPGVNFGSAVLGSSYTSGWNAAVSGSQIVLSPSGATAPAGNYPGILEFCLDNFSGSPIQQVSVSYFMNNSIGNDSIACTEILDFECADDTPCAVLTSDSIYCDNNGDYFIQYCIMNNSNPAFTAQGIVVNTINSGPPYLNVVDPITGNNNVVIPPLAQGATHCGSLKVIGPPPHPLAGDAIDLIFLLKNSVTNPDTCCVESDTLSVILPPCTDCCVDFDRFCQLIDLSTTSYSYCDTAVIDNTCLDSCHFTTIDWGDGQTDMAQGKFSFTHNYTSSGTFIACATYRESSDGGQTFCWDKVVCDTFIIAPCPGSSEPCDSIVFDPAQYGKVFATCYSGSNPAGAVAGIMDITQHQQIPSNANWGSTSSPALPANHGPAGQPWNRSLLGEVFGIAFDPTGNIYLSSTIRYPGTIPTMGMAGRPAIYKIDAVTGIATVINSTLPSVVGGELGYGNIAYNYKADVLYISNYEDGIIYGLDMQLGSATYGQIDSQWDFGSVDLAAGAAPLGDIVHGIGYNHVQDKLYYYLENINLYNQSIPAGFIYNEIRSIELAADGSFINSSDQHEFDIPYFSNTYDASFPVTDISFSSDGNSMLLSEASLRNFQLNAHESRLLEYKLVGASWNAEPLGKFTYNTLASLSQSCVGGGDYYYGDSLYTECDAIVLSTGDALHYNFGGGSPQFDFIYGIMGTPNSGGNIANSFLIDLDDNINFDYDKTLIGDVESYRNLCCGTTSTPDSSCTDLDWSMTDITIDTMCSNGMWPDITVTPILGGVNYDWVEYDVDCDNSIELTGPLGTIFTGQGTSPNYLICATFYKLVNGDTCDFQVIRDLTLEPCPDDTNLCDMLDWSQTRIDIDTMCIGNLYPDVKLTAQAGSVTFDWVDIDVDCNSSIDHNGGPGSMHTYSSNSNVAVICATFYKIINGDTCDYNLQFEEVIGECDTTTMMIDSCCIDQASNDARANQSVVTVASNGSTVTIDNPAMLECDLISATWAGSLSADLTKSDLPYTITFTQDGVYPVSFIMISYDTNGNKCLGESIIYQDYINETKDYNLGALEINPNPFQEYFSITMEQATDRELNLLIYDLTGKKVSNRRLDQGQKVFSISTDMLVDGMYFVRIQDGARILHVEKLIKM